MRNAPSLLRVGAIRDVVEVREPVLDLGRLAVLSRDFDLLDDVGGFVLVAHLRGFVGSRKGGEGRYGTRAEYGEERREGEG
jgi:hypothetical protein